MTATKTARPARRDRTRAELVALMAAKVAARA